MELFWAKKNSGFYPKYTEWYFVWCFHEKMVESMIIPHNLILTGWHLEELDFILDFALASVVKAMNL